MIRRLLMHYFPFLSIAALRYCLVFRLVVQHYGGMMRRDSIERERLQFEMCRLFIGRDWGKNEDPPNNKSAPAREARGEIQMPLSHSVCRLIHYKWTGCFSADKRMRSSFYLLLGFFLTMNVVFGKGNADSQSFLFLLSSSLGPPATPSPP